MKIKTYRAKGYMALCVPVTLNGKSEMIQFGHGSYSPRMFASLRTSNEDLQKALDKHPLNGKFFFLENTEYIANPVEEQVDETKPLEFNNFNELRDYLIKEHERAAITVSTMAKADKEMQKLGLKYIIK